MDWKDLLEVKDHAVRVTLKRDLAWKQEKHLYNNNKALKERLM